jgi:hypothetical protein
MLCKRALYEHIPLQERRAYALWHAYRTALCCPTCIPCGSSAQPQTFKTPLHKSFARTPASPNEDLVTGGDVVLAFDRVVKQEGRRFEQVVGAAIKLSAEGTAVYIDRPGRLNAKPLNQDCMGVV